MVPNQTTIAILQYGKLLLEQQQRYCRGPDQERLQLAEGHLINLLQHDPSSWQKQIFRFNRQKAIDPVALRILSHVAYLSLCTDQLGVSVAEVVGTLGGKDPARALETRQTISRLLTGRRLVPVPNSQDIELGQPVLDYLAGGRNAPPLKPELGDWQRVSCKGEVPRKGRRIERSVCFKDFPTPQQLAIRIATNVVGLDSEIRTVACRLAIHMRRAALIQQGKDPGSPNEALLFVGPSGTGKTWLAENAGRVCGLPFGAISSTDITSEGYIGMSTDDAIKQVIVAANNDIQRARYGICFFDEWDKKRSSGWEAGEVDISGASVQQSVLRLIEGCEFQVGGRRSSLDRAVKIDTHGMFFVFAGAFNGLKDIVGKHGVQRIGFASSL